MSGVEKDSVTLHVEGNTATKEGIENNPRKDPGWRLAMTLPKEKKVVLIVLRYITSIMNVFSRYRCQAPMRIKTPMWIKMLHYLVFLHNVSLHIFTSTLVSNFELIRFPKPSEVKERARKSRQINSPSKYYLMNYVILLPTSDLSITAATFTATSSITNYIV